MEADGKVNPKLKSCCSSGKQMQMSKCQVHKYIPYMNQVDLRILKLPARSYDASLQANRM